MARGMVWYAHSMLFLLLVAIAWALAATVALLWRNPLPIPDRGHRLFGVPDTAAQTTVLEILARHGLPLRFRFQTGPTRQSLLWDNETVLHFVDQEFSSQTGLTGSGISLPVSDPQTSAEEAMSTLRAAGFSAELVLGFDHYLPSNYLVIVRSSAFLGWVLVFRKHVLKMPRPKFI